MMNVNGIVGDDRLESQPERGRSIVVTASDHSTVAQISLVFFHLCKEISAHQISTHKFCVKVTEHNFSGNTRAITVTKVLSLDTPPPTEVSVENNIAATSEETTKSGNEVCGPSNGRGDSADGESKRISAGAETAKAKRPKC
ncbi:hypothetical protein F2Q70_00002611 [Brassica cretica]|uniref:Uncharacterized protein n=1 Tax=Brassica cretica TaxID=69181 RepID=A0A8S9IY13_BRACR|nr:hypothetical protein F2Q70_00002611 [Brassica cretica]